MAAFRNALSRAKPWAWGRHHHQRQLLNSESRLMGGIRSLSSRNFLFHNRGLSTPLINLSRRHYHYVPPPPSFWISGSNYVCGGTVDISHSEEALQPAEFAVMMYNETEGRNIRLVRVVRASGGIVVGFDFYLTLEAIDENGDLNVYYAEVNVFDQTTQLRKWQLVDESFSYPRTETSVIEGIARKIQPRVEGDGNIFRAWLPAMRLHYHDEASEEAESSYTEETVTYCSSPSEEAAVKVHTRSPDVNLYYDMIDCGKIVKYASLVLEMLNKKGKQICLKEVLHARKARVDAKVLYVLLLRVMDEEKELILLHAIIEVLQFEEDLIKCHVVEEISCGRRRNILPAFRNQMPENIRSCL